MSWSVSAFHNRCHWWKFKASRIRRWINFFYTRSKHEISPYGFQQLTILIKCTRISIQVGFIIELRRIDKYRHYCNVIVRNASFNQRRMSCMKSSHRGNKTYCFFILTSFEQLVLEVCYLTKNFHYIIFINLFQKCQSPERDRLRMKNRCKITTFFLNKKEYV